jgi:hypothetical protein
MNELLFDLKLQVNDIERSIAVLEKLKRDEEAAHDRAVKEGQYIKADIYASNAAFYRAKISVYEDMKASLDRLLAKHSIKPKDSHICECASCEEYRANH